MTLSNDEWEQLNNLVDKLETSSGGRFEVVVNELEEGGNVMGIHTVSDAQGLVDYKELLEQHSTLVFAKPGDKVEVTSLQDIYELEPGWELINPADRVLVVVKEGVEYTYGDVVIDSTVGVVFDTMQDSTSIAGEKLRYCGSLTEYMACPLNGIVKILNFSSYN